MNENSTSWFSTGTTLTAADFSVLLATLGLMFFIGWWSGRGSKSTNDFFLGGLDAVMARGPRAIVLTKGSNGVTLAEGSNRTHLAAPAVAVANVSGAGDALIAGTLLGLSENRPLAEAVRHGLAAAALALQTLATVPADLTRQKLDAQLARLP